MRSICHPWSLLLFVLGIPLILGIAAELHSPQASAYPEQTATPTSLPFPTPFAHPLSARYEIESLFDHDHPYGHPTPDANIVLYTGAAVHDDAGSADDCCWWVEDVLVCCYNDAGEYWTDLRWDQDVPCSGKGGPGWLAYDGHPGYDMSCLDSTAVNAAGQGKAYRSGSAAMYIDHGWESYRTWYHHLSSRIGGYGEEVVPGQRIGATGSGHLHFEVRHKVGGEWRLVDPFGWQGGYTDPWPYNVGNLWAGGEPFPMGYLDQNNAAHGPFHLDRATIRDKWLAEARKLGSPIEDDWAGTCPVGGPQATCYYQGFERGYIYYQPPSGSAQVVLYPPTYLPRVVASEDADGWNAFVYIRNLGSSLNLARKPHEEDFGASYNMPQR